MTEIGQDEKYQRFQELHQGPETFVMPNPWDAGSARILTTLGFKALATTSAGFAFSVGRRDSSAALSRDEMLTNARAIVEATELPVSADLEGGFGAEPEVCARTIAQAVQTGLVGGSIEDATGDRDNPIYEFSHAVERIAAAAEAAKSEPFLLTARSENYLWGRPDLNDTIARLQAFSAAGADVLFAPGLTSLEDIAAVVAAVDKPLNVVMGLKGAPISVDELHKAGVKRISVGGSFARAALGAMIRAAREVRELGTFTYATDALSDAEANAYMSAAKRP
ncbi:Probable carboxyvinyl-carboxyphosphonate phosphorylmutase [hydrothermal vent metagenome]|uniref:Probable carboxyvinyl-carboxyphosphonate phosphorylmutase n=1 Tax=hydrothermal vent metagenome TaxID=652676 RepID=A0A3B0TDN9_9ZZZZ